MAIKLVSVNTPVWHELVHEVEKSVPVMWLKKMNHLVNDDVFQGMLRLFCQLCVEADRTGARVACFPTWFSSAGRKTCQRQRLISAPRSAKVPETMVRAVGVEPT
jgi:hypothetical protein